MRKHITFIFLCLCFLCHARNTNVLYNAVFDSLYIEGLCYKSADSTDLALERFWECEKLDAKNAALSFELSKIYLAKKDSINALSYLKKAYALDKENYFYAYSLAEFYDDAHDYGLATKIYEKISKQFPKNKNVLYLLARSYALNGEIKKSIKVLDKLEDRVGQNKMITIEKARLYLYDGKEKKAIKQVDALVKKYPVDADLYVLRADIKMQINKQEEAIKDYKKALELDPTSAGAQITLCEYYSETSDSESLEYYLRQVLANENINIKAKSRFIEFAIKYYQTRSIDLAEVVDDVFETVIKANSESTEALLMYARILLEIKNTDKALELLHSAVLLSEKCQPCWQELLSAKINEDPNSTIEEVNEIVSQAVSHFPNDSYLLFIQGGILLNQGETLRAFETLKKSLEGIDPKSKIAESIYIMMSQMNLREALLMARDGIMLFPNNLMLLNNYAYNVAVCWAQVREEKSEDELAEYKKFFDEAEKISESTVKADAINPYYLDTYAYILFLQGKYTLAKFYIEQALNYDKENNAEVLQHHSEILNAIKETETLSNKKKQNEK